MTINKLLQTVRTHRWLIVLNTLLVVFYAALAARFLPDLQDWLYWTPDARGYREAGQWLLNPVGGPPAILSRRPYPYPLFVALLHNPYIIWTAQFIMWLAAVNLAALSAYTFAQRRRVLAYLIVFMVMGGSVSLALLTFHALTESASIFLLAIWLFVLSRTDLERVGARDALAITLPFAILVLVKPLFQIHLLIFIGLLLWTNRKRARRLALPLVVALLPILGELLLNNWLFDLFALSDVTSLVFRDYYFPRIFGYVVGIDWRAAAEIVQPLSTTEMLQYMAAHPGATLFVHFVGVVFDNVLAGTHFAPGMPFLQQLALVHRYGLLTLIWLITPLVILRRRLYAGQAGLKLALILLFAGIIIFSSGVSFTQGDRPILPSLPLLAVFAAAILSQDRRGEQSQ